MQFFVFSFFITLLHPINTRKMDCEDSTNLTVEEKASLMRTFSLPDNLLSETSYSCTNFAPHFSYTTVIDSRTVYSLRYDRTDELMGSQFEFHRDVLPELGTLRILRKRIYCFIDGQWGYVVSMVKSFEQKPEFRPLLVSHIRSNMLEVVDFFQLLQQKKIAFHVHRLVTFLMFTPTETQLTPSELSSLYKMGDKSYIYVPEFKSQSTTEVNEDPSLQNELGQKFKTLITDESIHNFYLVQTLHNYINFQESICQSEEDKFTLMDFGKQLHSLIIFMDANTYEREQIIDFVQSFGRRGELADNIRKYITSDYRKKTEQTLRDSARATTASSSISQRSSSKPAKKDSSNSPKLIKSDTADVEKKQRSESKTREAGQEIGDVESKQRSNSKTREANQGGGEVQSKQRSNSKSKELNQTTSDVQNKQRSNSKTREANHESADVQKKPNSNETGGATSSQPSASVKTIKKTSRFHH